MTRVLWTMVGAAALVLSACSSDPPATQPTPTPPSSSTPGAPPNSTIPPTPDAEPESAEEFILRWLDASTRMQGNGDPAEYLSMQRRCDPCQQVAARVEGIYSASGSISFNGYRHPRVEAVGSPDRFQYVFQGIAPRTRFRNSPDSSWQTITGGKTALLVTLGRTKQRKWFVKDYGRTSYE